MSSSSNSYNFAWINFVKIHGVAHPAPELCKQWNILTHKQHKLYENLIVKMGVVEPNDQYYIERQPLETQLHKVLQ